jgi:hypothetical protein
LKSQYEAKTRRAYLKACNFIEWKTWLTLSETYLKTTIISKSYIRK